MTGTHVTDVLQSLAGNQRLQHQQYARNLKIVRTRFRCEAMAQFTASLRTVVRQTFPDWFSAEVFDPKMQFRVDTPAGPADR
jgi:hypothetical protein